MEDLELRPLTVGEILDRSFWLYRRRFFLFFGISAVPHLFVLACSLGQAWLIGVPARRARLAGLPQPITPFAAVSLSFLIFTSEALVVYFFTQGASAYAVSETLLGRKTSVAASLGKLRVRIVNLFAGVVLSGLAILGGLLLFFVPGVTLACRLVTALPAALVEQLGPWEAFRRSFRLTRSNVGRGFLIYLMYFVLRTAAFFLVLYPYRVALSLSLQSPGLANLWVALATVMNVTSATLVLPCLTIAATLFYFDLRVRKEGLDLRLMIDKASAHSGETIPDLPRLT